MQQATGVRASVLGEFAGAALGDPRRSARLQKIVQAMAVKPDVGFPKLMTTSAELEGCYRLLGNEAVSVEALLEPHYVATLRRLESVSKALVLHDTTTFSFSGESPREGLGPVAKGKAQGFLGHFALAVSADARRDPPASLILTRIHLAILAQLPETRKLPLKTVRDGLMAIARLGGHIKRQRRARMVGPRQGL